MHQDPVVPGAGQTQNREFLRQTAYNRAMLYCAHHCGIGSAGISREAGEAPSLRPKTPNLGNTPYYTNNGLSPITCVNVFKRRAFLSCYQ